MKPIRVDSYAEIIRTNCMSMLESALKSPTLSDKFNLSVNLKELIPVMKGGAVVTFSARAYSKLVYIVHHEDKEVAVHGTIFRTENKEPDIATFLVDDIFVYPQEVTGTFAEATDDYGDWLAHQPDEVFNHLRFQAHSHVRMAVSPSGVDTTYYGKILTGITDFYVFMILNKSMDVWCEIYDVENNIYYEKQDVIPVVQFSEDPADDSAALNTILKKNVTAKTYAASGYSYTRPASPSFIAEPATPKDEKKKKGKKTGTTSGSKNTGSKTDVGRTPNGVPHQNGGIISATITPRNGEVSVADINKALNEYNLKHGTNLKEVK